MITHFQGRYRRLYPQLSEDMFRLRADAFWIRQQWRVSVVNGQEIDELDEADPLYVLSINPVTKAVEGTFRLLPTTGPTIMKSSLSKMFENPVDIESPFIWECSRFAASQNIKRRPTPKGICPVTAELMIAACSLALEAGISQLTAVFNPSMLKIYRRAGWPPEILECSNTTVGLGLWDVSQQAVNTMRELNQIDYTICSVCDLALAEAA